MIYTQTGVLAKQYTVVDGMDDFAHLVTTTATPTQAQNLTNNQLETFKHTSAPYVVYGLFDGTDRADSEVTARTILFLDVDGNEAAYNEVRDSITTGLLNQYNLVAYPTISNGIKEGARIRIGIDLSRPAPPDDYIKVWRVVSYLLNVTADEAGATRQFKQLAGTYVLTTQNRHSEPLINANDTVALPVDEFVKIFDENPNRYEPNQSKSSQRFENNEDRKPWMVTNARMVTALLDPENNYGLFGGWDNMLTSVCGWVYRNTGGNIRFTLDVVEHLNSLGSDPIPISELGPKFKSWVKNWRY
ncbi:hypothetical protein ACAW68_10090 [Weissella confusa]|uniref:hypothetical protein n=1 Tax=Weissella confusa TaxID=1583 RepID=UPI0035A3B7E5